jgi:hypothetical protein
VLLKDKRQKTKQNIVVVVFFLILKYMVFLQSAKGGDDTAANYIKFKCGRMDSERQTFELEQAPGEQWMGGVKPVPQIPQYAAYRLEWKMINMAEMTLLLMMSNFSVVTMTLGIYNETNIKIKYLFRTIFI